MNLSRPWKWVAGVSVCLALVGAGTAVWRHLHQASASVKTPPEIPSTISDVEIRAALERARNSTLSSPQSGAAWGELGLVFRAHGLNEQSNACFDEASRLDPTNPRWPYLIGFDYLLKGSDQAIAYLQTANTLATDPMYKSATRLRLAEAFLDKGELTDAEKLCLEETSTNPQNPRARFDLAVIAARSGDHRAAIRYLKETPKTPASSLKVLVNLAASHRQLGEIDEAERLEREAVGKVDEPWPDPFIAEYFQKQTGIVNRLKLIEDLENQERWQEAVTALEDLLRINEDDQILVSLGIDLVKLQQPRQAEQVLRAALAKSPDRAVAHDYLGVALYMQAEEKWKRGDRNGAVPLFEAAVKEFRQATKLNPKEGKAHFRAGFALKYLGKLQEAVEEYKAAILAAPEYAVAHLALGELLLEMKKEAEAIPYLEEAARLSPPKDQRAKTRLDEIKKKKSNQGFPPPGY